MRRPLCLSFVKAIDHARGSNWTYNRCAGRSPLRPADKRALKNDWKMRLMGRKGDHRRYKTPVNRSPHTRFPLPALLFENPPKRRCLTPQSRPGHPLRGCWRCRRVHSCDDTAPEPTIICKYNTSCIYTSSSTALNMLAHQLLHRHQRLVSHIRIFVRHQLHDLCLPA